VWDDVCPWRKDVIIVDMNRDEEPRIETDKALVPANDTSLSRRSLEVTRTYINRGNSTTRSLWVNIQPRNPILKAIVAVPAAAGMLGMLILMMVIAGFALLAMALMLAKSGATRSTK
jgi:ribosomal protein L16/L10AE